MSEILTVKQTAEKLGVRPQAVNNWVKNGAPVAQEKPRKLDFEELQAWLYEQEQSKPARKPRKKKQEEGDEEPDNKALHKLGISKDHLQQKLVTWGRGDGRGWALAKPTEECQPVVDDYIELINHKGQHRPASGKRLLEEYKQGKLFIIDLDLALSMVGSQVFALWQDERISGTEHGEKLKRAWELIYEADTILTHFHEETQNELPTAPEPDSSDV